MAEQQTLPKQSDQPEKKGFWQKTSLIQKIGIFIVLILFALLVWNTISGGIHSFYELIFVIIVTTVLIFILYIFIIAVNKIFEPKYFSPKEDFFTRVTNLAIDYCPANIKNSTLYFQGNKEKRMVPGGKIVGCLGLPYLIGKPLLDKEGNQMYYESKLLDLKVPRYSKIEESSDGDTLFIYETGFSFFKRKHFLRCNRELHSELNGDVAVYTINPVPFGTFWEYPYEQIQRGIGRLMTQSQLEVIISTHDHQQDLISRSADAGIDANPQYRMAKEANAQVQRE